jgi:hypothetical protein
VALHSIVELRDSPERISGLTLLVTSQAATPPFHDEVFRVCSAAYIEEHGEAERIDELVGHNLL